MTVRMYHVESSNLKALGYDQTAKTLYAEFKHGGTYKYEEVPVDYLTLILSAESVGSAFDKLIKKGGFKYSKVEPVAV